MFDLHFEFCIKVSHKFILETTFLVNKNIPIFKYVLKNNYWVENIRYLY